MPLTGARQEAAWPRVPQARLRPVELECLRQTLRAHGLTFAQWIRQQLSGVPTRGPINPSVRFLSFKLPHPYAKAAYDALRIQAFALESSSQRERKDRPLQATADHRLSGEYLDAASFFGSVDSAYEELRRRQQEAGGDDATA